MRFFLSLLVILLLSATASLAQDMSIDELKQAIQEASSDTERMPLYYQLGQSYLRNNPKLSIENAKKAHKIALEKGNKGTTARAAYLIALGYERTRDKRNQEVWLKSSFKYAKAAGYSDLIIKSVSKRSQLAVKERNYRKAYEINQEAFNFFSKEGTSMSELASDFEKQRLALEKEKKGLVREKDELEFLIKNLRRESDQLNTDKKVLEEKQAQLLNANKKQTEELTSKEEQLADIEEQKKLAEEMVVEKQKKVKTLTREKLEQKAIAQDLELEKEKLENEANKIKLAAEQSKRLRDLSILAAIGVLLLALVFYARYRSKRKAEKELKEKNQQIEAAKERSEELLLNILPAPIAEELKQHGKAKAHRYGEASVLFTDFKNFTKIAEQLTPEELVEELDKCFKAFDFIIGKYPEIEKIKTIGDAYMCASGLDDRKSIPTGIVKAALEIQDFMREYKSERLRLGKPFFEARIGIHTGPVVAGVVGVKKFAYDIWGDTVNIASRVEGKGEPGLVNISESTYRLVKYNFDCEYRGKVEAKNKGLLDMYFVKKEIEKA